MKTHRLAVALALGAFATSAQAAPLDRFYAPSTPSGLRAMAAGPDGRVWLGLRGAIGAIDRDGAIVRYPTGGLTPRAITAGPDGAVWFIARDKLARLAPGGLSTIVASGLIDASSVAAGPDGRLWVAERDDLARVSPDGAVRRVGLGAVVPWWIASGPDGNVWFTGSKDGRHLVGRVTPDGDVRTYPVPALLNEWAPAIVAGGDGNLWVATGLPDALARVTPAGVITTVDVGDVPLALAVAPDGALWFTTFDAVVRRAPDGTLTRFRDPYGAGSDCDGSLILGPAPALAVAGDGTVWTPYPDGALGRFAAGPAAPPPVRPVLRARGSFRALNAMARGNDGSAWVATERAIVRIAADGRRTVFHPAGGVRGAALAPAADGGVWFSPDRGLGRLSPGGRVRSYTRRLPRGAEPNELAPGRGGSVWYVDLGRHTIARVTPSGRVREVRLGRRARPFGISARPGGGVWVTDSHGAVERVTAAGHVRRFPRTGTADVPAIATAPDGSAWFVDFSGRRVSHITVDGHIRRYRTHGHPTAIAIGPDGATWFTTAAGRHGGAGVGRVDAAGREREFPVRLTCDVSYLGLIVGPDENLWFSEEHGPVAVAELDPRRLVQTGAL